MRQPLPADQDVDLPSTDMGHNRLREWVKQVIALEAGEGALREVSQPIHEASVPSVEVEQEAERLGVIPSILGALWLPEGAVAGHLAAHWLVLEEVQPELAD